MTTEISTTVGFALANVPNLPPALVDNRQREEDESTWTFGLDEQKSYDAAPPFITDAFVYVFQALDGGTPELYAEFGADHEGMLSYCEGATRLNSDADKLPSLASLGAKVHCLPDNANGKVATYFFFATCVRLSLAALKKFAEKPQALALFSIKADNACRVGPDGITMVPVLDPLFTARQLSKRYREATNALFNATTIHGQMSAEARQRAESRQNILLVAKYLDGLLKQPGAGTLKSWLADKSGKTVSGYVETVEREATSLRRARRERGDLLCRFLSSKIIGFTQEVYRVDELNHFTAFLQAMADSCVGLNDSSRGRRLLEAWLSQRPYWLDTYVIPETDVAGDVAQVVRKSFAAITSLWAELAPAWVELEGDDFPKAFKTAAQHLGKGEWVSIDEITSVVERGNGVHVPIVTRRYTQLAPDRGMKDDVKALLDGAPGVNDAFERLGHVIEIANLALATRALYDTLSEPDSIVGFDSKSAAFLNLVGSALDAVSAFKAFHKLGEWGLRRVAIFSAMIDIYLAGRDAVDAAERGDTAGVVGSSLVGVGTALTLVGTCASASAALAAAGSAGGAAAAGGAAGGGAAAGGAAATSGAVFGATIAGFAGAILIGAGYIVLYANQPPPPLKTFIQHCRFGRLYGKAGEIQPWSAGDLKAWSSGYDGDRAQVVALHNLILCFGVQGLDLGQKANLLDGGFRLYHPPLNSRSIIYLDYDAQYTPAGRGFQGITKRLGGKCRVTMKTSKQQSRIVLSNAEHHFEEMNAVSYGMDDAHVSVIDVVLHPKVLAKNDPPLKLWDLTLSILIDINGDGKVLVPSPESVNAQPWDDGKATKKIKFSTDSA